MTPNGDGERASDRLIRFVGELPGRVADFIDFSLFPQAVRDSEDFTLLRRCTYAGFALLAILLVAFSAYEHAHFALTQDFAAVEQVWHQVAHGDLNPRDTIDQIAHYWQVHLELYIWLIAPLGLFFDSALTLQVVQDASGIVACVIAWRWMLTILYSGAEPLPYRRTLALLALVMLVFDPWIYWSYAFDFHSEPIAVSLLIAAGYAFYLGKTRNGIWLSLAVLLVGDVAATYVAGLGLTLIVASRKLFKVGVGLLVLGIFWLEFSHRIGAGVMSPLRVTYGYLIYGYFPGFDPSLPKLTVRDLVIGLALHPLNAVVALRDKLLDVYANLAPIGFIGIFSPWTIGLAFVVIAENQLAYSFTYSQPNFQAIALYAFGTVGFAWFIAQIARSKFRRMAVALSAIAAVNAVCWFAVWMPELPPHWVRTSSAAAASAESAWKGIAPGDEVATSHGLIGRFADRASAYSLGWVFIVPRESENVQFVIAPYEGINVESVNRSLAALDVLVNKYGATLRSYQNGVWWLTIGKDNHDTQFVLPEGSDDIPAWPATGLAGIPVVTGPPATWHAHGGYRRGYVMTRAYWRKRAGNYVASVDVAAQAPGILEVWDATSDLPIVRRLIRPGERRTVAVAFRHLDRGREHMYSGLWPFIIDAPEPPVDDNLEVRVYTYGRGPIDVYRVALKPLADGKTKP